MRGAFRNAFVLGAGFAFVLACGGKELATASSMIDASVIDATVSDASAIDASAIDASATCSSIGAWCQVFEPDGPERWGCATTGTDPELACEHAAGASIARCNCVGRFGEGDPPIAWFDLPATNTPFSEAYVVEIWNERCNGRCVSERK